MGESVRRDIEIDAVFDIETESWNKFVVGGLLHSDGHYEEFRFDREEDLVLALLNIEGTVWAHNGGGFDFKWFLDWLVKLGIKAAVAGAGSKIISVRVGKLKLLDSKALTKISLADLSKGVGTEKMKDPLPCRCGESCGGYCSISRKMRPLYWRRISEYLKADCVSLMLSLARLKEYAAANDLDLGATVGGAAWRNAKRTLELEAASLRPGDHNFAREAYFGGRVQLFRPYSEHGFECDVASMYPSRLAYFPLPLGEPERIWGADASRAFEGEQAGIYKAEVSIPEMHLPPLPVRVGQRVSYPWGDFLGTWTLPELRYAASIGVSVRPIEALVFPEEKIVFRKWVDHLFDLRANAPGGKKSSLGTFLKFYLNSLTGKFGTRPEKERFVLCPDDLGERICKGKGYCRDGCDGFCGAYKRVGISDFIYSSATWHIDDCAHVEWAAYLTSEARVEWHKQAISKNGGFDMVYGDTDSCFSEEQRDRNAGKELGQWEQAGEYESFRGIAPKVYVYRRAGTLTDISVKAKGLRLPRSKFKAARALYTGQEVGKEAIIGFKAGARGGKFFETGKTTRRVKQGFGDRILEPGADVTRAPTAEEVFQDAQSDDSEEIDLW